MGQELSEITGKRYGRQQVTNSRNRLRRMGLITDDFRLTEHGLDDILDRISRFAGRAAFDPTIRQGNDIGDDQHYLQVLMHLPPSIPKKMIRKRISTDDLDLTKFNEWVLGQLDSNPATANIPDQQREKIRTLLEVSNDLQRRGREIEKRRQASADSKTIAT